MRVGFVDLTSQYKQIRKDALGKIDQICKKSNFILGDELVSFEHEFAVYCKTKYAIGLNSGTDALFLALLSLGVGKGDEVIVPAFSFISTALAVSYTQAKPVFVDIDQNTYNIDASQVSKAITKRTRAIIPVHLFGQSADMKPIMNIALKYGLKVIEDAAQAHGAEYSIGRNKLKVGAIADAGCFSFYPTKNLSCFGDGGLVVTNNKKVYQKLHMLRDAGRSSHDLHAIKGYNSRLDTLQAAVLRLKLKHLEKWNNARRKNAALYTNLLKNNADIVCPHTAPYAKHVYHVYALNTRHRDKLRSYLKKNKIASMIHYPRPIHLQKAYKDLGYRRGDLPVTEETCRRIISLPMHPFLKRQEIHYVAGKILKFFS